MLFMIILLLVNTTTHKMQFNIMLLVLLINRGLGQNDSPDLEYMVLEQKEQLSMMTESINNLMADNKDLKGHVKQLTLSQDMVLEQKEQLEIMKESLNNLIADNKDLKERQAKQHALNFISFTAYASQPRSYGDGNILIFDQEVVNYGNNFNPSSSIFTCPVSAYYLFHASIVSERDSTFGSRIYLDETFIIGAYSDGAGDSNTYDTASMLIVTMCEEGSSVSVRARFSAVLDGNANRESMFTGTLLALV